MQFIQQHLTHQDNYVIAVYTPTYKRKAESEENSGVKIEWRYISSRLLGNKKFIPILFGDESVSVPSIASYINYLPFTKTNYYEQFFKILGHILPVDAATELNQLRDSLLSQPTRRIKPPTTMMSQVVIIPSEGKSTSRPSSSKPSSTIPVRKEESKHNSRTHERTITSPPLNTAVARSVERPMSIPIPEIAQGHEEIYRRFINGKLIYKPNKDNDVGRLEIPFSVLSNPFEGVFDLWRCGDVWKYISISTGYRKDQKAENANKVEVWIVPKFVVEKNLSTSAKHLASIMDKFTSPVGIFWTWGNWDNRGEPMGWYDYLTVQNFDDLSNGKNLYKKWRVGRRMRTGIGSWLWVWLQNPAFIGVDHQIYLQF